MRTKSVFCGIFCFLFMTMAAFCQKVNFFTPVPSFSFEQGLYFDNTAKLYPRNTGTDVSAALDFTEFKASAGFFCRPQVFDFTTEALYAPTFWNCFNAGVNTIFHFVNQYDSFCEADLLTGLYASYHTDTRFSCMVNFLWHGKAARIYALEDDVPWLTNSSMAMQTKVCYKPLPSLKLFTAFSSFTHYRYMLYFSPDFLFGAEWNFYDSLCAGFNLDFCYVDMFTLSSNLDRVGLRFYARLVL